MVKIINRKYTDRFSDTPVDWLLGNVTDEQKLTLQVEVGVDYRATQQSPVQIDYINNAFIISNGKPWGGFGFDIGMTFTFSYRFQQDTDNDGEFDLDNVLTADYTIANIYGNVMEVTEDISASNFENIPIDYGTKKISEVIFFVERETEGCRMKYGHIRNEDSDSETLESVIDGTITEFGFKDLQSLPVGVFGEMEMLGLQSGMSVRSARIRRINSPDGSDSETFIKYKNVGNPEMRLETQDNGFVDYHEMAGAFKMTAQSIPNANFKNVTVNQVVPITTTGGGGYTDGASAQAFIYNSDVAFTQDLFINHTFRVLDTNDDSRGYLSLILLRYTGGTDMEFAERIELKRWEDANALTNQPLNFSGIENIDVQVGESYVLGVEWFRDSITTRWVDVYIENIEVEGSHPNTTFNDSYKKYYEIEIAFMISSMFEDISNFENNIPPNYIAGNESLTDNYEIIFFPEWNNPNISIKNELLQTQRLGNTGWFNENFNELANKFTVDSIEYFDASGNKIDSLDYSSATKIKATIGNVPNLNAETKLGFGFAWIPIEEADFKEKKNPFYRNVFVQPGNTEAGFDINILYNSVYYGAGSNGASMDANGVKFTSLNGKIIFEANFVPTPEFSSLFDQKEDIDRNYIIWVSVADSALARNYSDRVTLLADFNQMTKVIPPAGQYPLIDNRFIEHPYDETIQGEEVLEGIVQDDFLCRMPFRIKKDGSVSFQKIKFGVETFNVGMNENFDLEKYEIDLSQYPTVNGVQQFNVDQSRGFKLNPGNNKNWVKVKREPQMDTIDYNGYLAFFGTKIRWEDWLLNQNAPSYFYDITKKNNGLNNDWVDYLRTTGWVVNFFAEIDAVVDGVLLQYRNTWNFKFADYDENDNVGKTTRYFRNSDNTLLNVGTDPETGKILGVILFNEPTRIEVEFIIEDDGLWDIDNTYCVTTIEIDQGEGRFGQRQISSVYEPENDNPLRPLDGETKLMMTVDGTQKILTSKCLVDPELLPPGARYRVTGRVGCKGDSGGEFVLGLYEFRYENVYE